jgi:hypothetical protein
VDLQLQLAAFRDLDPEPLSEPELRLLVRSLLLLIEELVRRDAEREAELQRLREELARLKGQSPPPKFPPARGGDPTSPLPGSSEADRKAQERRKPWQKGRKLAALPTDHVELRRVERATLPPDAQFKGYVETLVQDVVLQRANVCFRREQFYSPATGKTYTAPLPPGYTGQFGPGLRSLALGLCYGANVTMRLTHRFLTHLGVSISVGAVSGLLTTHLEPFEAELQAAVDTALRAAGWTGVDQTSTRVDGQNYSCQTLDNPLVSYYLTTPRADRLAVLRALQVGRPLRYRLDAETLAWFSARPAAQWAKERLAELLQEGWLEEVAFEAWLGCHFGPANADTQNWLRQAAALAAYAQEPQGPRLHCLLTDDAAVFLGLTREQGLCWVHDARHYYRLRPAFACFEREWERFLTDYWEYYGKLLAYREAHRDGPDPAAVAGLEAEFDALFGREVYYAPLAECLARTRANKTRLLRVLQRPELPLHNNGTELAARQRVRRRDVSFGPRSEAGRRAWDVYQSLAATVEKLGVSFFGYLRDRIGQLAEIPPLAELVAARAEELQVGRSWRTA